MRTDKPPLKQRALQKLLLRRFGMAAGTYLLGLVLLWLALLSGFYRAAPTTAAASTTLVVACQLAFLWLFASGRNLRYADPSLTEPQVLVAIAWLTYFLYHVDSLRGTFMVFYVLALLFGVFQLPPRVFARCAALAFIAFSGIYLVEALQQRLELPGRAALQVLVMFIVMVWLSLFASYIQAMRQRMRQRRYALQAHQDTLRGMMRQLEDLVATDELTGLFNRRHFMRMASRALEDLLPNRQHGLALIDLDHFKRINDSLGHDSGDQLLKIVSERIRSVLRDSDVVARFAGDEFCVLADLTQDHEAHILSQRLMQKMKEPIALDGRTLVMTASVGVSLYPNDGEQCEELLKNAGLALHQSKACGRNNAQFFSRQLLVRATQELQMEEELRQALRDDQLELHYQPILALADGEVHQLEALVRWRHPTQGLLGPDRFIGLAEANGMIDQLDDWVLRRACRDLRSLHLAGHERLRVAVNCCASNLGRASLVDEVRHALEQAGLAACFLELEVTEDALMYNIDQTIPLLERLRELGVSLSIDDFGTGYSSLAYLRRLPLDALKVDRSFIMDIPASQRDMEIAQAIIAMAQKLHLKVVAEGVETPQQLAFLRENHCELVQGYLFSRPLPLAALEEFLRAYRFDAAPPLRSLNQA